MGKKFKSHNSLKRYLIWAEVLLVYFMTIPFITAQQNEIDHWETVIYDYEDWKYFVGTSEPESTWRTLSFDDSSWSQGPGGIGYGDGDDRTDISQEPAPLSLYLRNKFTIYDTSAILLAALNIDYDDAFVAYINDVEVARVGIGATGDHPAYNQPAAELREAIMYQGFDPEYFMINKTKLEECLVEGENILAIQVHNFNNTSLESMSGPTISSGIRGRRKSPGLRIGSLHAWIGWMPICWVTVILPLWMDLITLLISQSILIHLDLKSGLT